MLRWLAALAALLALAACERAAPVAADRPALWRATDGDTVVWLFGTIHVLPAGVVWNVGPVAKAVAASDTLVTEILPGDPQAQAATFLKLARAEGLPPLAERVPADGRAALSARVAASGIAPATLDRVATWAAALMLTSAAAEQAGATRAAAPEAVLAGNFAGRRHEAFETLAGQLRMFAGLPEAAQVELLVGTVRETPADAYARLLSAWRRGDVAALATEADRALADAPMLRSTVLTARNRAWADALVRRGRGTVFAAVGAGHLVGSDGLPALLSARGFRVARMQ